MLKTLLRVLLLFLLYAGSAFAQSTTVSGQVTDLSGQAWTNGTFTFAFNPNPSYPAGPYTWTGGTLPAVVTGVINSVGAYSASIPSNTAISPIGSSWIATFCSQASSPCFTIPAVTIAGATQTLNITPPAIQIDLTNATLSPIRAYSDSEIAGAFIGSFYYNLPNQVFRVCQVLSGNSCTVWADVGTGGSSGTPRWDQILNPNINKDFDFGGTATTFSNGSIDFSGLTSPLGLPRIAGCVTTAAGQICYDSTNGNALINNGSNLVVGLFDPSGFNSGDIVQATQSGGQWVFTSAGAAGGTTGGTVITANITNLTLGDTLCADPTLTPPWTNCAVGVPVNVQTGDYTFDGVADRGTALVANSASPHTYTLGLISDATDFDADWFVFGINENSGTVTVSATAPNTFASTGNQTETLLQGQQCSYLTDPSTGTIYPKCHEPRMTATSPIVFTRSPYGLGVSCPTCGTGSGNLSGALSSPHMPVATGATTLADSSVTDDGTNPTRSPNGSNTATNGNYEEYTVDTGGVTVGLALCVTTNLDGSGRPKVLPCSHLAAQPGAGFVGIAKSTVAAAGTVAVCWTVNCSATFDNTSVALNEAILSVTTDGRLHDTGSQSATAGQPNFAVLNANAGIGTNALISLTGMLAQNPNGGGGNGNNSISINGTAAKKVTNFNGTTPAADANNQLLVWKASSSGNTTSAVVEVPLATTGQAGIVQLAGDLAGTSSAPTIAAQYKKLRCETGIGDGLNAMSAGTYLQFFCVNTSGVTWTITGINCWTDNAGTSTLNAANNAGTGLLTGAVTCNSTKSGGGAAGTQSGTTTLANNDAISFTFVADGTSKQTTWTVSLTQ
jgi:hypothetical protein